MHDALNFQPAGMRASWSTCTRTSGRFTGVIKEIGSDAWVWHCERALGHAHETRKEARACARARIERQEASRDR